MSDTGEAIRFLCDEDFDGDIVKGVRRLQPRIDIQTANEAGTSGLKDPEMLAHAAAYGLILLSRDSRTMPGHFGALLAVGNHSPGVVIVPQSTPIESTPIESTPIESTPIESTPIESTPIGQAIQDIVLIWAASWPEEYADTITRLSL